MPVHSVFQDAYLDQGLIDRTIDDVRSDSIYQKADDFVVISSVGESEFGEFL